jgi:hypothetical protein
MTGWIEMSAGYRNVNYYSEYKLVQHVILFHQLVYFYILYSLTTLIYGSCLETEFHKR